MEGCFLMKKLRERLSNKKGFTLVELIVVIVIILILAAVLIPNVMRYIESARKSAFQSEASGYLTEITGYQAEYYATTNSDLTAQSLGTVPDDMELTGYSGKLAIIRSDAPADASAIVTSLTSEGMAVYVKNGAVTAFGYSDGKYWVSWSQPEGWTNVVDKKGDLAFKS